MLGAIIGDIVGSRYEFNNIKSKDFSFVSQGCTFTDDTVMTIAVARALIRTKKTNCNFKSVLVEEMQALGNEYPDAGYGGRFFFWLGDDFPEPYNSFGNGSAMRVSPCGLIAQSLEEALSLAEESAEVTHNHPEGIKGAQAVAAAIYLAKTKKSKAEISQYIREKFYPLEETLDEIRPDYSFDETCQGSVPQAIIAFLESENFEDAIRNAVSIGGDSDTIAAITGSVALAFYKNDSEEWEEYSEALYELAKIFLPEDFIKTIDEFEALCNTLKQNNI